ncbi:hypothetical protein BT96DRAFT_660838 [Gymnopus androsaceus JB14]|uniref:Uncharacterized protein n=1 Tax=Gymnopus androsaceus JB14 TaxID=1447944 RepID=A0A6A4HSV4_9AGAR|nr:hypothetical protein BT96DRAFT_660838 [Gymnopus androsaceus JB14]
MDARQDPTVLQVLSQALKDSQSNATRLQVELDAALATIEDLQTQLERKPIISKGEPIENNESNVLELARLHESNKNLEENITTLNIEAKTLKEQAKKLEGDVEESSQHATALEEKLSKLAEKYSKCREKKQEIQQHLQEAMEKIDALQSQLPDPKLEESLRQQHECAEVHKQLRSQILDLPLFSTRPTSRSLLPIPKDSDNILDFLKTAASSYHCLGLIDPYSNFQEVL